MKSPVALLLVCAGAWAQAQSTSDGFDILSDGLSIFSSLTSVFESQATANSQSSAVSSVRTSSDVAASGGPATISTAASTSGSSIDYQSTYTPTRTFSTSPSVAGVQTSTASSSHSQSDNHSKILAIVLSTVLGALAIGLLILLLVIFCCRRRRRRSRTGGRLGHVLEGRKSSTSSIDEVFYTEKNAYTSHAPVAAFTRSTKIHTADDARVAGSRGDLTPNVPPAHELSDDPFVPVAALEHDARHRSAEAVPPYGRERSGSHGHPRLSEQHGGSPYDHAVPAYDYHGTAAGGPATRRRSSDFRHRPQFDASNRRRSGSLGRHSYVSHPDTESDLLPNPAGVESTPNAGMSHQNQWYADDHPSTGRSSYSAPRARPHGAILGIHQDTPVYGTDPHARRGGSHSRSPARSSFDSTGRRRSGSTGRNSLGHHRASVHDPMPPDAATIVAGATTAEMQRRSLQDNGRGRNNLEPARRRSGPPGPRYSSGTSVGQAMTDSRFTQQDLPYDPNNSPSPTGFHLPRPRDDSDIEAMFADLMHRRGWYNLPQPAVEQMLAYSPEKKWQLVHQDRLTEWRREQSDLDRLRRTGTLSEHRPETTSHGDHWGVSDSNAQQRPHSGRLTSENNHNGTATADMPPSYYHTEDGEGMTEFPFSPDHVGRSNSLGQAWSAPGYQISPADPPQQASQSLQSHVVDAGSHTGGTGKGAPDIITPGAFAPEFDPFASQRARPDLRQRDGGEVQAVDAGTVPESGQTQQYGHSIARKPLPIRALTRPLPTPLPPRAPSNTTVASNASIVHHLHHGGVQTHTTTTWLPNGRRRTKTYVVDVSGGELAGRQKME